MICRLLQDQAPACRECGATTMISLERGREALRFGNLELRDSPSTRKERIANIAGGAAIVAGYGGLIAGSMLWWPAIPIILGLGGGGVGLVAWRSREVEIAKVELHPVKVGEGAVEKRGIARKLSDSVRSVVDGAPLLVEQVIVRTKGGDVLLRRTNSAPFVVDVDGERVVVTGAVRLAIKSVVTKLDKKSAVPAALGIPPTLAITGKLDIAQIRDGDRVTIRGVPSVEMVPELAFHRDAGETAVMRGVPNAVVAISS
jgi:hypothetical protein